MKYLILLFISIGLMAFQNCSDASFSDTASVQGKVAGEAIEPGPGLNEVAEEDREEIHEYYRCGYDDDSESSYNNRKIKVALCHNDHVICISENALRAHLIVHLEQQGDEHVDNYGACHDDDEEESDN